MSAGHENQNENMNEKCKIVTVVGRVFLLYKP